MRGNLFSLCKLFRVCNTCAQIKWVDRVQILPPVHPLLKSMDTPLMTRVIFSSSSISVCLFLGLLEKTDTPDYTPTSLKAENDICYTQIIVNFLLCEILSLMKILRLHEKEML